MKEWMRGIKYRMKDGMGPDPRKHNFQRTVGSVICVIVRNWEIEKNKWFSLQYILFCN